MDRRSFVKLFGGLTLAGLPGVRVGARANRIGVVGGGIIGASVAYHLVKRGADVTLFEKERPAAGATGNSFAWINAGFSKRPWAYYYLNRLGIESYRRLQHDLGGELDVQWGGSLQWHDNPASAQRLRAQVRAHQKWGYPINLVDQLEFERLSPNLIAENVVTAAYGSAEGTVDPVHVVDVLLSKARAMGLKVESPCEVTGLDIQWGRLRGVKTSKTDVELDVLVVAAGVDTPRLAAMAGLDVPLKDSPGILAHTTPQSRYLDQIALAPNGHIKQDVGGRIVTGATFSGTPEMKPTREQGESLLDNASQYLQQVKGAELEKVTIGWRVLPQDDYPIVGFDDGSPDIYLAAMHSGITMAPLMGRLISQEILDDTRIEMLQPFRLSRFREKHTGLGTMPDHGAPTEIDPEV